MWFSLENPEKDLAQDPWLNPFPISKIDLIHFHFRVFRGQKLIFMPTKGTKGTKGMQNSLCWQRRNRRIEPYACLGLAPRLTTPPMPGCDAGRAVQAFSRDSAEVQNKPQIFFEYSIDTEYGLRLCLR